ncbi:hypothetical protein ALT721_800025 [Alteromonas alvinellae]
MKYEQFSEAAKVRARDLPRSDLEHLYTILITSRYRLKRYINAYQVTIAILVAALIMALLN